MPLRLFGGRESSKVRTCPACEQAVAATATFCPSCYMVFRPEGAADLREYLQGGRIPSDVYLLRRLNAKDPDTGPVVRVPGETSPPSRPAPVEPAGPVPVEPAGSAAAAPAPGSSRATTDPEEASPAATAPVQPLLSPGTSAPEPPAAEERLATTLAAAPSVPCSTAPAAAQPRGHGRAGVELLLTFRAPLPPPTRSIEETRPLFAWMLEQDPVIPNNLERLQQIHAGVFRGNPAERLGYEQHILLQVADDLALHPTRDGLTLHLMLLAAGYRRAAEAYHVAARREEREADGALWQMASLASRLRIEAWVYRSRHGVSPEFAGRARLRTARISVD